LIATAKQDNSLPYVIDLFSGCGGMSLGFSNAGFPILASIDIDDSAAKTAEYNLHHLQEESPYEPQSLVGDVRNIDPSDILPQGFDSDLIVIGGPPCQAYSMAGRGKLKSLGAEREHTKDKRGNLYIDFLNFAITAGARAIIMENVPAAVNYGGKNIPEDACSFLEKNGYSAIWTILNAADFGVPQRRDRMFLIATKSESGINPFIPKPEYCCSKGTITPAGRSFSRFLEESKHFVKPHIAEETSNWVTVGDALSDLPQLFPSPENPYHLPKPSEAKAYRSSPKNDFQRKMRGNKKSLSGHAFRRTSRDFPIFEKMKAGDDYRDAVVIAEKLLREKLRDSEIDKVANPTRYKLLKKQTIPPYSLDKFYDKWKKLDPQSTSHTVPAHLGTDTYSHIHPEEPRGISVREAARLQSFPDNFVFPCSMGDAFKQIGNAVPPLLAEAIAKSLKQEILLSHE
jgi:DNA (cytosine-5)-methyltransferase 1